MQIARIKETIHKLSWLLTEVTGCLAIASEVAILACSPPYIYYLSGRLQYTATSMNCGKASVGHFCCVFVVEYAHKPRSCSE